LKRIFFIFLSGILQMEQFNYHKLVNLKKRLLKYDCEYSKKIMEVIDGCITDAKAVSKKKDEERRLEYNYENVDCEICGKEFTRGYIYKHKRDVHHNINKTKKSKKITPDFDVNEIFKEFIDITEQPK